MAYKILLVDSASERRGRLAKTLSSQGFDISESAGAIDAAKSLVVENFDTIVCEVEMEGVSGIDFLKTVKRREEWQYTLFFLVADEAGVKYQSEAIESGADAFILRPADELELAEKINAALRTAFEKFRKNSGQTEDETEESIEGELSDEALEELIHLLELKGGSGAIKFSAYGQTGEIFFKDGSICDAQIDKLSGQEAFYRLALWTEGSFVVSYASRDVKRTITKSHAELMNERNRRVSMWNALRAAVAGIENVGLADFIEDCKNADLPISLYKYFDFLKKQMPGANPVLKGQTAKKASQISKLLFERQDALNAFIKNETVRLTASESIEKQPDIHSSPTIMLLKPAAIEEPPSEPKPAPAVKLQSMVKPPAALEPAANEISKNATESDAEHSPEPQPQPKQGQESEPAVKDEHDAILEAFARSAETDKTAEPSAVQVKETKSGGLGAKIIVGLLVAAAVAAAAVYFNQSGGLNEDAKKILEIKPGVSADEPKDKMFPNENKEPEKAAEELVDLSNIPLPPIHSQDIKQQKIEKTKSGASGQGTQAGANVNEHSKPKEQPEGGMLITGLTKSTTALIGNLNDKSPVEKYIQAAKSFLEDQDLLKAREIMLRAQQLYPSNAEVYFWLGEIQLRGHKLKDSLSYFKQSVEKNAKFAPAYMRIGYIYEYTKNKEEAKKAYETFLTLVPKGPDADKVKEILNDLQN